MMKSIHTKAKKPRNSSTASHNKSTRTTIKRQIRTTKKTQQQQQQQHHHQQQQPRHFSTTNTDTTTAFIPREIKAIYENKLLPEGAGAKVRRSIGRDPRYFSPFPLLDHFYLAARPGEMKGFTPHSHRGMATFTMMKKGFVKHKDSKGNQGIIGPGDCQYLRCAKGIVHSEMPYFPPDHDGNNETNIEGIQLWFNLPRELKMADPAYQDISSSQIPRVTSPNGQTTAHIIMGKAMGAESPIKTDTPAHYINYILGPGEEVEHVLPGHWNTFAYVIDGSILSTPSSPTAPNSPTPTLTHIPTFHTVFFKDGIDVAQSAMAAASVCEEQFDFHRNQGIRIKAGPQGADIVLVGAEPLDPSEGVYQHGPFVLNSRSELQAAIEDFQLSQNGFEGAQKWIEDWKP